MSIEGFVASQRARERKLVEEIKTMTESGGNVRKITRHKQELIAIRAAILRALRRGVGYT